MFVVLFFSMDLSYNSLKSIPDGLPPNIESLNLENNNITSISKDNVETFKKLTKLEALVLRDNYIKLIYDYQLMSLRSLQWIELQQNPLVCIYSLPYL